PLGGGLLRRRQRHADRLPGDVDSGARAAPPPDPLQGLSPRSRRSPGLSRPAVRRRQLAGCDGGAPRRGLRRLLHRRARPGPLAGRQHRPPHRPGYGSHLRIELGEMARYRVALIGLGRIASTIDDEVEGTSLLLPWSHVTSYRAVREVEVVAAADL